MGINLRGNGRRQHRLGHATDLAVSGTGRALSGNGRQCPTHLAAEECDLLTVGDQVGVRRAELPLNPKVQKYYSDLEQYTAWSINYTYMIYTV